MNIENKNLSRNGKRRIVRNLKTSDKMKSLLNRINSEKKNKKIFRKTLIKLNNYKLN